MQGFTFQSIMQNGARLGAFGKGKIEFCCGSTSNSGSSMSSAKGSTSRMVSSNPANFLVTLLCLPPQREEIAANPPVTL